MLTAVFIILSLLHYFSCRPLWLDESIVYESLQKLSAQEIFGTLVGSQVFPRVYLFCVKLISEPQNYDLLAVRFLSLVFMLGAYFVWRRVYSLELKEGGLSLLAVASFVSSYQLSYYASELKPYSMDVLTLGLYAFYIYYQKQFQEKPPDGQFYLATFAMPLLIFFSYAGLFVFWVIGWNFIWFLKNNKRLWTVSLGYVAMSLFCFLILYKIDLQFSVTVSGLYDYWKDYFLGTHSFYAFVAPFGEGVQEQATWWFGNSTQASVWFGSPKLFIKLATPLIPIFVYALARFGFGRWIKDKGRVLNLCSLGALLFLELIILSVLKKYPFTGDRITLFFAPFVFLFIILGIDSLKSIRPLYYMILPYYVFFLVFCGISTFCYYLSLYFP